MGFDRKYMVWALGYAVVGMSLGIYMGASHNHIQHVTHAHIQLVGFVLPFIYAVIHKLWLAEKSTGIARLQFIIHQAGAVTMLVSLFMLFGNVLSQEQLDPVLGISTITVLVGLLLMLFMVVRSNRVKT